MLQVNFIRENKDRIITGLQKRGWSSDKMSILDSIIEADDKRKALQTQQDEILSKINSHSKEIGGLFKSGKQEEANLLKQTVTHLKEENQSLDEKAKSTKETLADLLYQVPNVPNDLVPAGTTDEDNEVFKDLEGGFPELGDSAMPHWELASKYNLIDFAKGVQITGAGFPVYLGKGARLQRALVQFFLNEAGDAGYTELNTPFVVNEDSARGTGQLPDKEGQMYHAQVDNFYLIPTAEVPVTNMHRNEILAEADLPKRYTAFSPCFRREAGSYGADVKGLNRLHQFEKVEIVQMVHPSTSYEVLDKMLDHVEGLLKKLELPYRILRLCGGDLGFTSALTYDFEVYSGAQKRWLEVSSVSNFETFQSNRLKMRFKDSDGKKHLVHTLNGSALALPRIMASILENNQTSDGIVIPEVLRKYTGFDIIN